MNFLAFYGEFFLVIRVYFITRFTRPHLKGAL